METPLSHSLSSIDVIKDFRGMDWIVEIGDGQVSGLTGWTIQEFWNHKGWNTSE